MWNIIAEAEQQEFNQSTFKDMLTKMRGLGRRSTGCFVIQPFREATADEVRARWRSGSGAEKSQLLPTQLTLSPTVDFWYLCDNEEMGYI